MVDTLVELFNRGVDFVRQVAPGEYREWVPGTSSNPNYNVPPTHQLVCTHWNSPSRAKNIRTRRRENLTRPTGFALSVCAVPLTRRLRTSPQRLQAPIGPKVVYDIHGPLEGKRSVLRGMVQTHVTPVKMQRLINKLPHAKLDALYRSLLHADKAAVRKARRRARRAARKAVPTHASHSL